MLALRSVFWRTRAVFLPSCLAATSVAPSTSLWPFAVLGISLVTIILLVSAFRVHAFFALIFAAILTGVLAQQLPGEYGTTSEPKKEKSHWVQSVELTAEGFGKLAGRIGVVIALASVIGTCLVESGAAEKVVRRFLGFFGEKNAGSALLSSSFILSIPIFFETFFMLLLPMARALRVRTGKNYMLFVLAICCGGTVTHSLVAPHPGPLGMAENLHLDVGHTIVIGLAAGIIPCLMGWLVAGWAARRLDVPMRETGGISMADLEAMVDRKEDELPGLVVSLLPVLLPLALIGASSFLPFLFPRAEHAALFGVLDFIGHKTIALIIGAGLAVALVMKQRGWGMGKVSDVIAPPFATAGVIILIACAGGAFGTMLQHAGVGDAIKALAAGRAVNIVLLAWSVSAVIRVAQGSATVAMLTTSSMIAPMISDLQALPYHPMYIFLAIGFGSKMLSWMNDSGFWAVSKLSGFTEKETLQSWTLIVSTISTTGLIITLIASTFFPCK